jgi:hypothetical protein
LYRHVAFHAVLEHCRDRTAVSRGEAELVREREHTMDVVRRDLKETTPQRAAYMQQNNVKDAMPCSLTPAARNRCSEQRGACYTQHAADNAE